MRESVQLHLKQETFIMKLAKVSKSNICLCTGEHRCDYHACEGNLNVCCANKANIEQHGLSNHKFMCLSANKNKCLLSLNVAFVWCLHLNPHLFCETEGKWSLKSHKTPPMRCTQFFWCLVVNQQVKSDFFLYFITHEPGLIITTVASKLL